ncbi:MULTISPECIES: hypothetical protein [Arsenophonus]|uniref:hypothetical protein n=1 Tax=Arsenophonus TaxID=637 RepID=UPI00387A7814
MAVWQDRHDIWGFAFSTNTLPHNPHSVICIEIIPLTRYIPSVAPIMGNQV